ncbi:transposase [Nonomuraea spiralis]|uniref:Transposase n=1 Tax=Nonomuraea spiralis TaxID=46182 RepID=A0ABV5ILG8_9ACTN
MRDRIAPLMPADPTRGRRWADHRRTLETIAWKYRTGSPWRDLPNERRRRGHRLDRIGGLDRLPGSPTCSRSPEEGAPDS